MSQPACLIPWLTTRFPFLANRQKEQLSTKGRPFRGMSEEEVFTEVANLFRGQEDLLSEFGQFLPEAKRSLVSTDHPPSPGATFSSAKMLCLSAAPRARPGLSTAQDVLGSPRSHTGYRHPWVPVQAPPPSWSRPWKGFLCTDSAQATRAGLGGGGCLPMSGVVPDMPPRTAEPPSAYNHHPVGRGGRDGPTTAHSGGSGWGWLRVVSD